MTKLVQDFPFSFRPSMYVLVTLLAPIVSLPESRIRVSVSDQRMFAKCVNLICLKYTSASLQWDLQFLGLIDSFELCAASEMPVPTLMMRASLVRMGEGSRKQSLLEACVGLHAADTVIVVSWPRQLPAKGQRPPWPAERYLPKWFCSPAFTSRTASSQVDVILHFQKH